MNKNIHTKKSIFEYSKITDYIYIGTNQCCNVHFKESLLKKGIKADISLEEERIDQPFGVDYYLWLPTEDHTAPTFKQLLIGANFIEQLINNKIKVYVHCKNGHGRSPTLVIAHFILKGKSVKEAVEFVQMKRPVIHLTESHIKALKNFKARMKNGK